MGSYQRQHSRSTAGNEPHVGEWKTYKKEREGKRLERERQTDRQRQRKRERLEKRYLWTINQNIKMGFLNIPLASSLFCSF